MSTLKFNTLLVPHHESLNMCELGTRWYSVSLFILLYNDGQETWKTTLNVPITRDCGSKIINI